MSLFGRVIQLGIFIAFVVSISTTGETTAEDKVQQSIAEMYRFPLSTKTPLTEKLNSFVSEKGRAPGIFEYQKLLNGMEYEPATGPEIHYAIELANHSEALLEEMKAARLKLREKLEPLEYSATVTVIEKGKSRTSKETALVDGHRACFTQSFEQLGSEKFVTHARGFDGEYYFTFNSADNRGAGTVNGPPNSRAKLFPRSHLLQQQYLMLPADFLGTEGDIHSSLDSFTATCWPIYDHDKYDKSFVAYGDALSFIVLDPDNYYCVVGGESGRLSMSKDDQGHFFYHYSESYSTVTCSEPISVSEDVTIFSRTVLRVQREGNTTIQEDVKIDEIKVGDDIERSAFDIIPTGTLVTNFVDKTAYRKGDAKTVELATNSLLNLEETQESDLWGVVYLIVALNVLMAVVIGTILYLGRKKRRGQS